jgi:hypothetical protein
MQSSHSVGAVAITALRHLNSDKAQDAENSDAYIDGNNCSHNSRYNDVRVMPVYFRNIYSFLCEVSVSD